MTKTRGDAGPVSGPTLPPDYRAAVCQPVSEFGCVLKRFRPSLPTLFRLFVIELQRESHSSTVPVPECPRTQDCGSEAETTSCPAALRNSLMEIFYLTTCRYLLPCIHIHFCFPSASCHLSNLRACLSSEEQVSIQVANSFSRQEEFAKGEVRGLAAAGSSSGRGDVSLSRHLQPFYGQSTEAGGFLRGNRSCFLL